MNNNMYNGMNNMNGTNSQTSNSNNVNPQINNINGLNQMYNTSSTSQQSNSQVDPMAAVANLNKEDAMEEALSHTNQYTPFEAPKQEVLEMPKKENSKSAYILIGIIIVIMALFIAFLPQISKMFGW